MQSLETITPLHFSSLYATEPVGMDSGNWFVNAAAVVRTTLAPVPFLTCLLELEKEFGRQRNEKSIGYQNRTLDLDLLLFDDIIFQSADLVLPHPQMHRRLFVLKPLAEIAPGLRHPVKQKSIIKLLDELPEDARSVVVRKMT